VVEIEGHDPRSGHFLCEMASRRGGRDREESFNALFRTSHRDVRAFVARRTSDPQVVEEVVSHTFTVAWDRFDHLPEDPSHALAWLYRIALYTTWNEHRGQRRRRALHERLSTELPAPDRVELDDEADSLAQAFATLSESDRSVLLLSAWEGLDNTELAQVLGTSAGAAGNRLWRARQRLEAAYRSMTDDDGEEKTG
jgi:RNA polymerase sigma-70 factor, ECF subfamily